MKKSIWNPFWAALILAIGLIIGSLLKPGSGPMTLGVDSRQNKINEIINYIENDYVDPVNADSLLDKTLSDLLKSLDPHSAYIPAQELGGVKESIEGSFDGIGVEFSIQNDTVMVVAAISGGPSEALGIQSGDRIIKVEDELIAGTGIKNQGVIDRLRGESGSKVNVEIYRPSIGETLDFEIKRGKIPIYSVDVSFLMEDNIGYIKLNRFTNNSYREYIDAMVDLERKGIEKLILDLRGNPGGLLSVCLDLADEFLEKDDLILYTQGKSRQKREYFASGDGNFKKREVVVLIDEGSASASEIIAGALQDNDRGLIVGRRSFGKGLVQEPIYMADGSAIHLTTSRYYTPSGRSIQRDYENGIDAYYDELTERYESGEMFNGDSAAVPDSLTFKTKEGRVVYGGGGITPDVYVALDTTYQSAWYYRVYASGAIREFAFAFADKQREDLLEMGLDKFVVEYNIDEAYAGFMEELKSRDILASADDLKLSSARIRVDLKALVARQIWNNEGWYRIHNDVDPVVKEAKSLLQKNKGI